MDWVVFGGWIWWLDFIKKGYHCHLIPLDFYFLSFLSNAINSLSSISIVGWSSL